MLRAVHPSSQEGSAADAAPCVRTADGASARVAVVEGREQLELRDREGRLLFAYDAESGRGVLSIPVGDLELEAPNGDVVLRAGRRVRLQGGRELELRAGRLAVSAGEAELRLGETRFVGERFDGVLRRAKLSAEKLETVAGRLLERAVNVYRQVQRLHQLKAGRVRTLVEGSYHVKSGDGVFIKSDEIAQIDGKQVHLG
jgi:Protein of unknown function (DUF3540)